MAASDYHTYDELQTLGERVRDSAIQVSVDVESARVVQAIHADHQSDPMIDSTGRVAPDPTITQQMIRSYAQQAYNDVPRFFTAFATPDPAKTQPTIDTLWDVAYALDPTIVKTVIRLPLDDPIPAGAWHPHTSIGTRVQDISIARLKYWSGPAADSFEEAYLNPLTATVTPQSELAAVLALTLTAHQRLRETTHNNIWQIGQETLKVLDTLRHTHPHDAQVVLTALTAAITVLLAIPTDGLSFAYAFGLAKTIQGFATAATNVPTTIGGKTVNAVIISMAASVTTLTNGIDDQERAIMSFLDRISSQIRPTDITPPAPAAVTNLAGAGLDTLTNRFHAQP